MELVDVEYVKEGKDWFLRVFLDKEGGIDVEDCREVSVKLSDLLDEADPIANSLLFREFLPARIRNDH